MRGSEDMVNFFVDVDHLSIWPQDAHPFPRLTIVEAGRQVVGVPVKLWEWGLHDLPARIPLLDRETTVRRALTYYLQAGFDDKMGVLDQAEKRIRQVVAKITAKDLLPVIRKDDFTSIYRELDTALLGATLGVSHRFIWEAFAPLIHGLMTPVNLVTNLFKMKPDVADVVFSLEAMKRMADAITQVQQAFRESIRRKEAFSPLDKLRATLYLHRVAEDALKGQEGYLWLQRAVAAIGDRYTLKGTRMMTFNDILSVAEDEMGLAAWVKRNQRLGHHQLHPMR